MYVHFPWASRFFYVDPPTQTTAIYWKYLILPFRSIHPTPHSFDKTPFALVQSAFLSYPPVFVPLLSVSCRIVYWIGTETCMLWIYQEGDKLTHTQVTEPRYWQKGRKEVQPYAPRVWLLDAMPGHYPKVAYCQPSFNRAYRDAGVPIHRRASIASA